MSIDDINNINLEQNNLINQPKIYETEGREILTGKTFKLEQMEPGILIYRQKYIGGITNDNINISIEEFIDEQKNTFQEIGLLFQKTTDKPVIIVDYSNVVVGKITPLIAQKVGAELLDNVKNKYGTRSTLFIVGIHDKGFLIKLAVEAGSAYLQTKRLIATRISTLDSMNDALNLAYEISRPNTSRREKQIAKPNEM